MEDQNKTTAAQPKLYRHLASWWPLLSAPADYAEEARFYCQTLQSACAPRTLLELGSGGGNNASHLKAHFDMTLVDISAEMLKVSGTLNPECRHVPGDMRTVRLNELFDAVFVHDAIAYMISERDLKAAIQTAWVHCRPGGAALFAPDFTTETFAPTTYHGGHDGADRGMRYLGWIWDPDPDDTTFFDDMAYLMRDADGKVTVEYDRHISGLFPRAVWLELMNEVGFEPQSLPTHHSAPPYGGGEVFLARRPRG